ncbi:helix-turn-helix transcriptional regulator [Lysinibacillus sp. FSL K6-0057]|uniref:helix-turn-helix domain-containing protein n=1 Tax=Lysinibacillus sp. FSL K6-0057 TaxID=2921411 RepID=UPI00315B3430
MNIEIKLKELLKKINMEQKELAELTGLSSRTISELVNNKTERIPKTALVKIAIALNVNDIRDLIDFAKDK